MLKTIGLTAATLGALIGLGYIVTLVVVKPMSTDLSVVGQGRPALVLAYENFSPSGGEALDRLRQVRSDYESRLDFLVADLGTPEGRAFANRFQLLDGQAVFLKQDGQPLRVTNISADERELRNQLDYQLVVVE